MEKTGALNTGADPQPVGRMHVSRHILIPGNCLEKLHPENKRTVLIIKGSLQTKQK